MSTTNLMAEITSRYSKMTKAEKKVADFVLSSPQEALQSTITDLSRLCDVGETSVFRFCRTLSLKGYQDFKMSLALSTSAQNNNSKKESVKTAVTDTCQDTAQSVLDVYIRSLEQAAETLNYENIPIATELLTSSKTINIFGFGGSGTSADEMKNKFMKILPNIIFNPDAHMQLTQAALLGKDDLAVIFCNSGITKDCIEISRICHEAGTKVIFITMFQKTPAAQYSDIVLHCGANEGPMEGGSIAAKTAQLFLIDILYAEVYKKMGKTARENKQKTAQIITEKMM